MGERTSHAHGTISWADLATTDLEGAKDFYAGLFGWQFEDMPAGEGMIYSMAKLDGRSAAAASLQMEDERAQGVPPHWNVYVTVDDVDATTGRVADAGGQVFMGPFDVLEAGRMSVIADPTGAALCLWEARSQIGAEIVNVPGALSWADCATPDPAAASAFYAELLGWRAQQMSEEPPYWVLFNGERSQAGLPVSMPGAPAVWFPYFATEVLDPKLEAATEAGGTLVVGPVQVPQGRFAILQDPQGAVFALFEGQFDD